MRRDPASEEHPRYPKFTRPQAVAIVVAIVVVGGGLGLWMASANADVPPSSLILPLTVGAVVGFLGGTIAYMWGRRRMASGRSMPRTVTGTAALAAGAGALLLQTPGRLLAGVIGFCLALPAIIIFLVHVWPRRGEPYS